MFDQKEFAGIFLKGQLLMTNKTFLKTQTNGIVHTVKEDFTFFSSHSKLCLWLACYKHWAGAPIRNKAVAHSNGDLVPLQTEFDVTASVFSCRNGGFSMPAPGVHMRCWKEKE